MIHECYAEVTCDNCHDSIYVQLEYRYRSMSPASGFHNSDDSAIEETLEEDNEWIVTDGKHYCCAECADEAIRNAEEQ